MTSTIFAPKNLLFFLKTNFFDELFIYKRVHVIFTELSTTVGGTVFRSRPPALRPLFQSKERDFNCSRGRRAEGRDPKTGTVGLLRQMIAGNLVT